MAEHKEKFIPGKDWVWYSRAIYGEREIKAVLESLNSDWLVPGAYSKKFEQAIADSFGQKYGLFVNSGSSANLIAVQSMNFPAGSEVITPACTFATTINPIIQLGLIPVLIDVHLDTYNTNIDLIEAAISPKTVALMIPHLVGNLNDMKRLRAIADKHKLILIEDSCDTVGGTIDHKPTGILADFSTTSFYASHIITAAGGGGMLMLKDEKLLTKAKVLRDWGRALPEHFDESPDKRFVYTLEGIPHDGKFIFESLGYNLKPIDLQAAFGLVQLERLAEFSKIRKNNFKLLNDYFSKHTDHFILPKSLDNADVNWLAYPITIRKESPLKRVELMRYLEEHLIQTRVLFSGNIIKHPAYKNVKYRVASDLKNSDYILEQSLLVGCHHGLSEEHIKYIIDTIDTYLQKTS